MKGLWMKLRATFLAGVLVIVPVVVTFLALRFLFRTIDGFLGPLAADLIGHDLPGLGLAVTLLLILLAGLVARNIVGRRMLQAGERALGLVPLVRGIYRAAKDIITALTVPSRQLFREVVLVEYPRKGSYSYGFVTSYTNHGPNRMAHIYLPSPPVPTTGTLILVPAEDLIYLDLSIEETLKLILSAGVVTPEELPIRPPDPSRGTGPRG